MNAKASHHHHYLSQCYLKGFTDGRSKKSKLTVIDSSTQRQFVCIPRNIGGVRDFNRIEVEGIDPNALEHDLSVFETRAAMAIKAIEKLRTFEGENKDVIINLIALLAVRSPQRREHMRRFQADIVERIMELALASKERWESQMRQMREAGVELEDGVSYEDMRAFVEGKQYRIEVDREWHISQEFAGMEAILPYLFARNWVLLERQNGTGPFVTSDRPVILTWNDPESVPLIYRHSPGYGLNDTSVFFPLSQDMALRGEFDGREGLSRVGNPVVAQLNSIMVAMAHRQIYAPKLGFPFIDFDGNIADGRKVMEYLRDKGKE